mmetsp:Transcript_27984/g.68392  ORF Transcript_27984/g.68392 Transcript_27984/m.68392 type:complete len:261 (+) Transcript_27984:1220-2002(+)
MRSRAPEHVGVVRGPAPPRRAPGRLAPRLRAGQVQGGPDRPQRDGSQHAAQEVVPLDRADLSQPPPRRRPRRPHLQQAPRVQGHRGAHDPPAPRAGRDHVRLARALLRGVSAHPGGPDPDGDCRQERGQDHARLLRQARRVGKPHPHRARPGRDRELPQLHARPRCGRLRGLPAPRPVLPSPLLALLGPRASPGRGQEHLGRAAAGRLDLHHHAALRRDRGGVGPARRAQRGGLHRVDQGSHPRRPRRQHGGAPRHRGAV